MLGQEGKSAKAAPGASTIKRSQARQAALKLIEARQELENMEEGPKLKASSEAPTTIPAVAVTGLSKAESETTLPVHRTREQPKTYTPGRKINSVRASSSQRLTKREMKRAERRKQEKIDKALEAWGGTSKVSGKHARRRGKRNPGHDNGLLNPSLAGSMPRSTTWHCSLDIYGADASSSYAREVERSRNRNLKLETAIKRFNYRPEKAIDYIMENHILPGQNQARSVAKWLYEAKGLSKKRIGEFLGKGTDFAVEVLSEFTNLMDFAGEDFDESLRRYLQKFCLPGEAQQIDRIMEKFAFRWHETNPGFFKKKESAYIMAFALIMLNTDAHNDDVERKMTRDQFVMNNREILPEDEVPTKVMEQLYDRIVNNEITFPTDHNYTTEQRNGWLMWYAASGFNPWKKRFIVLKDNVLNIFANEGDENPRGIIFLDDIIVSELSLKKQPYCFQFSHPRGLKLKIMDLEKKIPQEKQKEKFIFAAENNDEQLEWIADIRGHVRWSSFMLEEIDPRLTGKGLTDFPADDLSHRSSHSKERALPASVELAHEPDKSLTENEADKPLSDQASLIDNLSLNNHDDTASDAKAGSSADSTMETSTEETTDAVSKENSDACAEESSQPESLN